MQANLAFARKQTSLALTHLRDALEQDDATLLNQLGWTREEATEFLKKWETLHSRDAKRQLNESERRQFERNLRNMGLGRRTTDFGREAFQKSNTNRLRDARRLTVPEAWREQVEAYSKGVAEP